MFQDVAQYNINIATYTVYCQSEGHVDVPLVWVYSF